MNSSFTLSNLSRAPKILMIMILAFPISISLRNPRQLGFHTHKNVLDEPPRSTLSNCKVDLSTPGKPEEREILMDFWNSTNGEWWTDARENNWGNGDHCTGNWTGGECSGGEVVTIEIVDNNQTGELSESLGGLGALDRLSLSQP